MHTLTLTPIALGLVLLPAIALVSQGQSFADPRTDNVPSSPIPAQATETATAVQVKPETAVGASPRTDNFGWFASAYSSYCLYRFNGSHVILNCSDSRIKANSRVFVAMSEYNTTATNRFIGAARMTVHNVRPYNGGVNAWVDVEWGYPLNVRLDILVDP